MAHLGERTTFDKLKPGDVFRFGEGTNEAPTYIMGHDGYFWNPITRQFNEPGSESPTRRVTLVLPEPPEPPAPVEPTGLDSPIIKFDTWMPLVYQGYISERGRRGWYFTPTPDTLYTWDEVVEEYRLKGKEFTFIYPVGGEEG